ncbi:hypothetical protein V8C42DRAFT_350481 [Trichoderma barbatum]
MRLINVKTFKLEEFLDYRTPPYAILSHTWGDDSEELNFRDVQDGNIDKPGIGSVKFRGCCRQAAEDNLGYALIDTCCIDKTNLVELSEAINSMFRWYQSAFICYAFLSDVPCNENTRKEGSKFRKSRCADKSAGAVAVDHKMMQQWYLLGTKGGMSSNIASITGIPRDIAQRMPWAAHRDTKRKEDLAYCLLEGGDQAFFRLQEQIMKVTRDDSILEWGLGNKESPSSDTGKATAGRVVAKAPMDFANSGHIIRRDQSLKHAVSLDMSGGSIRAYLPLLATSTGQIVGLLSYGPKNNAQQVVGIPLIEDSAGSSDEYARPRGHSSSLHLITASAAMPKPIRIKHDGQESAPADSLGLYFHYEENDFTDINLNIIGVMPQSCWDEEQALIMSMDRAHDGVPKSKDFVVVLDLKVQNCDTLANCLELAATLPSMMQKLDGKTRAKNEHLSLLVTLERDKRQPIFIIRAESILDEWFTTLDATMELNEKKLMSERLRALEEGAAMERRKKELEENLEEAEKENTMVLTELQELEETRKQLVEAEKQNIKKQTKSWRGQAEMIEAMRNWAHERNEERNKAAFDQIYNFALSFAAAHGLIEVVKQRLDEGADVDVRGNQDFTPLVTASLRDKTEMARLLIKRGARIGPRNKDGITALFAASASTCLELEDITPLMFASRLGSTEVVQLLLNNGADMEVKGFKGVTALMIAFAEGHAGVVQLLTDRDEWHIEIVRQLLDIGQSDLYARNKDGRTALDWAIKSGHEDMIQLLRDAGKAEQEEEEEEKEEAIDPEVTPKEELRA